MKTKVCSSCKEEKTVDNYHSTGYNVSKAGIKTKSYKPTCKVCANAEWKRRFEAKLVAAGIIWKCTQCGYDKCRDALDFHHLDPKAKEFTLSAATTLSEKRIKEEVSKGIVLCANCHREVHAGVIHI